MPLDKSKSKDAFSRNVSAEMNAGKPQKQALAIAFSVQRKARADGGGIHVGGKKITSSIGGVLSKKPWKGYKRGGLVRKAEGGETDEPQTRDRVVSPDAYLRAKRLNSDPKNIYDDQGNIVDYDTKDWSKKADGGSLPDVGDPLIGSGPQISEGSPWANRAADIGSKLGYGMALAPATVPYNIAKNMVEGSKESTADGGIGEISPKSIEGAGSLVMQGLTNAAGVRPTANSAGVFVGPYGAHMLREEARDAGRPTVPHPVVGAELSKNERVKALRPEFQDIYKGSVQDMRDAQARQILEANPNASRDVFYGSGWSRGAEGAAKKEIQDTGAKLVEVGDNKFKLEHPAGDLHKIYDIPPIKFDPNMPEGNASHNRMTGDIIIGGSPTKKNLEKSVGTALHEVQHRIQRVEGFGAGSNPIEASKHPEAANETFGTPTAWQRELMAKEYPKIPIENVSPQELSRFMTYRRASGEVEAENVKDRRAKSFRYMIHPEDTEKFGRGVQWVNPRNIPREYEKKHGGPVKKADGGSLSPPPWFVRNEARNSGMLRSSIPGRTDKIPLNVQGGSYVLPADIPSALGQGNTMAGGSILDKMFTKGPYGMNIQKTHAGNSTKMARMSSLTKIRKSGYADGGDTHDTPIIAAGGEYVLTPEQVAQVGGGNIESGHKILDAFVNHVRKQHIKTLKGLPGPKKD